MADLATGMAKMQAAETSGSRAGRHRREPARAAKKGDGRVEEDGSERWRLEALVRAKLSEAMARGAPVDRERENRER